MKCIRKIFGILSEEQKLIISNQYLLILEIVKKEENKIKDKLKIKENEFEAKQATCNACKSNNIVNKIAQEIHTGTNLPRFIFQQQTTYSYTTKLNINHCSDCGNEWEKKRWRDTLDYKMRDNYRKIILNAIKDKDKYPSWFELKVNKEYKDFYAESMHKFFGELSIKTYRKVFKSIFEE